MGPWEVFHTLLRRLQGNLLPKEQKIMTLHLDQPLEQNKQAKEGRFSGEEGWGGRRRQLGSLTIHAVAAFLKRPQGKNQFSSWLQTRENKMELTMR